MKCNKHFKKLSAAFLASAFSLTIFMQGTLAVIATEESAILEDATSSKDNVLNSSDERDKENDLLPEITLDSANNSSPENKETVSDEILDEATTPSNEAVDNKTEDASSDKPFDSDMDANLPENVPDKDTRPIVPDASSGKENQESTADNSFNGENQNVVINAVPAMEDSPESDTIILDSENAKPFVLDYAGVSDLRWCNDSPGSFEFKVNDAKPGYYVIRIYKDGNPENYYHCGDLSFCAGKYFRADITKMITGSGDYTFQIKITSDDSGDIYDFSSGQISEISPVYHYEEPTESLLIPTGLQWDSTTKGLAKWNPVDNADGYNVWLHKDNKFVTGYYKHEAQADFSNSIGVEGNYTFRVQAISNDINKYANSEWSADSAPLSFSSEVDKTLEDIIQNDNATEAVSDLKDGSKVNKSELKVAMQSNASVQAKMQELENRYKEEQGITVSSPMIENVEIAPEKISVLGAGLNAAKGQEVTLKISKPDTESPYNPDVFKNVVQFNMDLLIDGTVKKDLEIPVTITLPVPDGMNVDRMFILHYSSADGSYDTIIPRNNGNGTVSFTITHFSTFAFAEMQDNEMSGSTHINKDDNNSATSGEETEIILPVWKPTTPDEIKRYACKGNEVIDYTLAKENTYPVVIVNAMQGSMCFASFEAVLGDYTIGRTYNIYPTQNLTYSMEKEVEITMKIPATIYQAEREYKMICVTKDGQPVIYEDLDKVPETITFKTNTFYAFALIYK